MSLFIREDSNINKTVNILEKNARAFPYDIFTAATENSSG